MSKFKQKHKITTRKRDKLVQQSTLTIVIILLFTFVLLFLFINRYKVRPNLIIHTDITSAQLAQSKTGIIIKENSSTQEPNITTIISILNLLYVKLYRKTTTILPVNIKKILNRFLEGFYKKTPETLLQLTIQRKIILELIQSEQELIPPELLFFKVLLRWFKIIKMTVFVLEQVVSRNTGAQMFNIVKFSIQTLLVKPHLSFILKVSQFKNILSCNETTPGIVKMKLFKLFRIITDDMISEVNIKINLNKNLNEITIKYLITSLEYCRRFFILNILFIYLHLFDISNDFEITGLNEKAHVILTELKGYKVINKNRNKGYNWDDEMVQKCKSVIKDLKYIDRKTIEHFFVEFMAKNNKCLKEIEFLVQSSLFL